MTSRTAGRSVGPVSSHQMLAWSSRTTTGTVGSLVRVLRGRRCAAGAERRAGCCAEDLADAEVTSERLLVELGDRRRVHDLTGLQQVRGVDERQPEGDVLLDEHHRDAG